METLQKIGEALYGPRWQSELARDLDVNDRTVRRWASGESVPPETLEARLRALVSERIALLRSVLR